MKQTPFRLSKLSLGLVAALAAAPVFAQSLSSGIAGQVTDTGGAPVAAADVTITNTATGAVSHATTGASGYYSVSGLQVGGPYTVKVSKGDMTQATEGVYLELNTSAAVNERLGAEATDLGTVSVTGNRTVLNTFNPDNKGLSTNISGRALETAPSGNRSLDDIARLDPRIQVVDQGKGSISVAGLNNRYNNISVDGLSQTDPFGLNANGLAYAGSPISVDTIAAYNISTTDFDTASDTVGANINAVTKSGTNEFHGSVYYAFSNADGMVGKVDGKQYPSFDKNDTYGITVGGPIVKDKLFFFASYEDQKVKGLGGSAASDGVSNGNFSPGDVQDVIDDASALGLAPGTYGGGSATLEDKRYLGKIDWNIADGHRASFTYQRTEETQPTPYDTNSSSVVLSSHWYNVSNVTNNYALQLFDDWTDNFSTEFKVGYQKFDELQGNAVDQPHVKVCVPAHDDYSGTPAGSCNPGTGSFNGNGGIYLGEDRYRHENAIGSKRLTGTLAATYTAGSHVIKGGFDYLSNEMFDLFGANWHGTYLFDSPEAFANGDYLSYQLTTLAPGKTEADASGQWKYTQISPFIQDTWQATDNLSLQYGVRMDLPKADHAATENTAWEQAFGYPNNYKIGSSNKVVEPRVSFNYQFDSEQLMQMRGGFGLFQSVPPYVWLTAPYLNNGGATVTCTWVRDQTSPCGPNPAFDTNPAQAAAAAQAAANAKGGTPEIDTIDPDFKLPTVWKASLAFDSALPWWDMIGSVEYQHLKNKDAVLFLLPNVGTPSGTLPDGRLSYWAGNTFNGAKNNGINPAFAYNSTYVTNTDKGGSDALTLSLIKPVNSWGLSGNLAVTLTHANEVNPGNSSQVASDYQYVARTNPNEVIASPTDYVVPLSVKASVNWDHAFFGDYKTTVSLFYNGHTGLPYSWVFAGDVNGDNYSGYDLAYIPTLNDAKVNYGNATQAQIDAFNKFIDNDPYLSTHRGQIAGRNATHLPWVNDLDVGLQQEIPGFFHDNKAVVRLDIYNFLNMLNKDWGTSESVGTTFRSLAAVSGITDGQYDYNLGTPTSPTWQKTTLYDGSTYRVVSRWSAMLTVRYEF